MMLRWLQCASFSTPRSGDCTSAALPPCHPARPLKRVSAPRARPLLSHGAVRQVRRDQVEGKVALTGLSSIRHELFNCHSAWLAHGASIAFSLETGLGDTYV